MHRDLRSLRSSSGAATKRCIRLFAILALTASAAHGQITPTLYWTNRGKIQSCPLGGGPLIDLISNDLNTAADVEYSAATRKLYWTDLGNRTVKRANADGTQIETLVPIGIIAGPIGLEIDEPGEKLYWADRDGSRIQRARLDGTARETVVDTATLGGLYQLDLDLNHQRIYWTANALTTRVLTSTLDGADIRVLLDIPGRTGGIALDVPNNRMFWSSTQDGSVWKSALDGSSPTLIYQFPAGVRPLDMEFDGVDGRLYIADNQGTRVWRLAADGSDAIAIVDLPDPPPWNLLGVAVANVPEPATVAMFSLVLVYSYRSVAAVHRKKPAR